MRKIMSAALVVSMAVLFGCSSSSDDDDSGTTTDGATTDGGTTDGGTPGGNGTTEALPAAIDSDLTLNADIAYEINGLVEVNDGATLTIPAGTVLYATTGSSYLAVNQGGMINAVGTADNPIVFTSQADFNQNLSQEIDSRASQGQWGGLSIFGRANTNRGLQQYEAGDHTFGCDDVTVTCDDNDSSGALRYVVLKHTGFEVEVDRELNGLSLGGVGRGTEVDHIAVLAGSDDGIEVWGGTVDITNAYVYNASDDSLDWDHGWTGSATNVYIEQSTVDGDGSRGMETDNNGGSVEREMATPVSNPTISGFTVKTAIPGGQGIVNREGTAGMLMNGLIVVGNPGKACVEVRSTTTRDSGLTYSDIACVQPAELYYAGQEEDTAENIFGTVTDAEVAALVGGTSLTQPNTDGISGYGADESVFAWVNTFLVGNQNVQTLPASIDADLTLDAGTIYEIDGLVEVQDGATLNIPAGTRLYGGTGQSYLAVNQGGTINANGTADNPILFTSESDFLDNFGQSVNGRAAQGQWGGLSIFGRANTNRGLQQYEAGDHSFGCDDVEVACNDADSSGSLSYIIVKHTGFEVEVDRELNGLSLGGVGSGTSISNVAVVAGSDDGIELWGGTVSITNAYVYNASDDSLDWDHGWTGSVNNILIVQETVDGDGSRGMETDNNGGSTEREVATPVSNPTIQNYTIRTVAEGGQGIVNREGTAGQLTNGVISVANATKGCVEVRSATTRDSGLAYVDVVCAQSAGEYFKGKEEDVADNIFGTVTDAEVAALVSGDVVTDAALPSDLAGKGADESVFGWVSNAISFD